jgi:hypothetical protein
MDSNEGGSVIDVVDFVNKLEALVVAESSGTKVLFDYEHLGRRDNQGTPIANRVVVCPGNEAGVEGECLVVKHAHRVPPDVCVFRQYILIECWAYDGTEPANKRLQVRALQALNKIIRRHTIKLVLSESHITMDEPPGVYNSQFKRDITPTERVVGARNRWEFWIDFEDRDIAPTTAAVPALNLTMHKE